MRPRRRYAAVLLAGVVATGCGSQVVAETPEARFTKKNAEVLLQRGTDGSHLEGPGRPVSDELESIDCTGGERASARGDFACTAVSETGWRVACEGHVTNGRVLSGGCRFLPRD